MTVERRSGAQLEHAILRQRPVHPAADHVAIESLGLGHVADQQDNMIDTFERERRSSGHGSFYGRYGERKRGGRSLPFPLSFPVES